MGDTGRGEGGRPGDSTNPYARDLGSLEGKVLRLTLDGQPAPTNPFIDRGGPARFVFASGLRNPFRFTFDPRTGLLWVADVGQNSVEEIDVVRGGDDLGWPLCEGFEPRASCPARTVPPLFAYSHGGDSASVTGGTFYDGSQFAVAYRGDYFFGDFVLDRVWRARLDAERTGFAADPELFIGDAGGPVDFTVGPDGALYYVAFNAGQVVRVTQDGEDVAPDACARALADAAPRLLRAAGRQPDRCAAECPVPRPPRGIARRLSRACGAPPPAAACDGLGCAPCATASDLGDCLSSVAASVAAEVTHTVAPAADDRCARTVRRLAIRSAVARLRSVAACARRGDLACDGGAPPSVAKLGRACRRPPAAVCDALRCVPCSSASQLGACVGRALVAPVDSLARTLIGHR